MIYFFTGSDSNNIYDLILFAIMIIINVMTIMAEMDLIAVIDAMCKGNKWLHWPQLM